MQSHAACLFFASVLASGCWKGTSGDGLRTSDPISLQGLHSAKRPAHAYGPAGLALVSSLCPQGLHPYNVAACRQHAYALALSHAPRHVCIGLGSPNFIQSKAPLGMCASGEGARSPVGSLDKVIPDVRYDFEVASPASDEADADARMRIWRDNQMAWSPLQSPVKTAQAITLCQKKAVAKASALCQRAMGPDEDSAVAVTQLVALIDDETSMRREISACVQLLLDSSPFRGVGSLAVDTDPSCRLKLQAWLRRSGPAAGVGSTPPVSSKPSHDQTGTSIDTARVGSAPALSQLLEECLQWQESKQAEEEAVLLPLIAFSCLKNTVAKRSTLDAKALAEIEAAQSGLAARSAMLLTLGDLASEARAGGRRGGWRRALSADTSGNLLFCRCSAALVRYCSPGP